ncbi:MAG: PDGLE domain-containing protein [Candidatus Omnitrophica bacterium]|nr:PDGLE domain-containing protein [Candidatus Omnitrophota bacterium]
MRTTTKLWLGIAVLILISPLGLVLPEYFKAGDAWGEWGMGTIKELAGYVPKGLERLSSLWSAPVPDYAFKGWGEKPLVNLSIAYIISAAIGIAVCIVIMFLLGKFLAKKE